MCIVIVNNLNKIIYIAYSLKDLVAEVDRAQRGNESLGKYFQCTAGVILDPTRNWSVGTYINPESMNLNWNL
jgi:hypothetical protein